MAFFFFFFFGDGGLHDIPEVQQAFRQICMEKMRSDGYFDMSVYISGQPRKEEMYASLKAQGSRYAALFRGKYPNQENAAVLWREKLGESNREAPALTDDEAGAIISWVYQAMKTVEERTEFTQELFRSVKELAGIQNKVRFAGGVVYNEAKVELHVFSSISRVSDFVSSLERDGITLFYRGHADPNYTLCPSILRLPRLRENESRLYHELLIECPEEFEKCPSHLEKLVKMQHYGLPTRLLDITRNLLVALYFACETRQTGYGELVLISVDQADIKYPQSDTASILASLPVLSRQQQRELRALAEDPGVSLADFNRRAALLLHEIRLEKPAFLPEMRKEDVMFSRVVYALKNNARIVKQDGAFILCGLDDSPGFLERFRYRRKGKKVVVLLTKKRQMLQQLENVSITRPALFPEIDSVAGYLKNKYS